MTGSASAGGRRLCMVVHSRYPVGETRVQREAQALVAGGWDVSVLCLRGPGEPATETVDGVFVRRLPVDRNRGRGLGAQLVEYLTFFFLALAALTTWHLRRRFDLVHIHNLPDFLVFSALPAKLTGASVVLDLHDLMPEFFMARTGESATSPKVRLVALQERLSCGFADHVITVTEGWRETLATRGVRKDKTSVVMNLADPAVFGSPLPKEPHDPDELRLLYHGTFAHRYGVDLLVAAVADLRRRIPRIELRLLGDGELRDSLIEQIGTLGLHEQIHMSDGFLEATALPAHIAWADLGLVPNRADVFTNGILPTKLLEYVALGTPVVVARTETVADYFSDDMVAFYPPGDLDALIKAIEDLHRHPDKARALSTAALRFDETHRWELAARSYLETLERLRT